MSVKPIEDAEHLFNELVDHLMRVNEEVHKQLFIDKISYGVCYFRAIEGVDGKPTLERVSPEDVGVKIPLDKCISI